MKQNKNKFTRRFQSHNGADDSPSSRPEESKSSSFDMANQNNLSNSTSNHPEIRSSRPQEHNNSLPKESNYSLFDMANPHNLVDHNSNFLGVHSNRSQEHNSSLSKESNNSLFDMANPNKLVDHDSNFLGVHSSRPQEHNSSLPKEANNSLFDMANPNKLVDHNSNFLGVDSCRPQKHNSSLPKESNNHLFDMANQNNLINSNSNHPEVQSSCPQEHNSSLPKESNNSLFDMTNPNKLVDHNSNFLGVHSNCPQEQNSSLPKESNNSLFDMANPNNLVDHDSNFLGVYNNIDMDMDMADPSLNLLCIPDDMALYGMDNDNVNPDNSSSYNYNDMIIADPSPSFPCLPVDMAPYSNINPQVDPTYVDMNCRSSTSTDMVIYDNEVNPLPSHDMMNPNYNSSRMHAGTLNANYSTSSGHDGNSYPVQNGMGNSNNNSTHHISNAMPSAEVQPSFVRLPTGYRFRPTDQDLIRHYLQKKVYGQPLDYDIIPEIIDIYSMNPFYLKDVLIPMTESEWYFFTSRNKKYPNGSRPDRSTHEGYWKATGTDKPIPSVPLITMGLKRTLDFFIGKQPRGTKTNWKMHEYVIKYAAADNGESSNIAVNQPQHGMQLDRCVLYKLYQTKSKTESCDDASTSGVGISSEDASFMDTSNSSADAATGDVNAHGGVRNADGGDANVVDTGNQFGCGGSRSVPKYKQFVSPDQSAEAWVGNENAVGRVQNSDGRDADDEDVDECWLDNELSKDSSDRSK